MSGDPLEALYDDPAVVRAMDVLSKHAITGEQYEQLVKSMPPIKYDPYVPERRCNHNGGYGIGAGHECRCNGPIGHSLTSHERPHGCGCGAVWADRPEPT